QVGAVRHLELSIVLRDLVLARAGHALAAPLPLPVIGRLARCLLALLALALEPAPLELGLQLLVPQIVDPSTLLLLPSHPIALPPERAASSGGSAPDRSIAW